jgi:hypothetical protein
MRSLGVLVLAALVSGCGTPPAMPDTRPPVAKPTTVPTKAPAPVRFAASDVDRAIRASWSAANVTPAKAADDATWLRRVSFDVVGMPPSPEELVAFVADKSPDKRGKKVDALLASPQYATHWTNVWDDILVGNDVRDQRLDRAELRAWLHARFSANAPWDKTVADLVSATGQNSEGGPRNALPMDVPAADGMGAAMGATADAPTTGSGARAVNGAVNYALRFQTPQDLAGSASRTFLGVQIQCAQCHDHKTEKWKQDDFRKLTAAFMHAEVEALDKGQTKGIRRVEVSDSARIPNRFVKNAELGPIAAATPTTLDGTVIDKGKETRKELAAWMTSPKNPWFAKAYVNRIWAHFLGRGFVNPVDDVRPSNPTTLPDLLDAMAKDFADGGFDPKALVRLVCATEVYGLDAKGGEGIAPDNVTWAKFRLVPLGPEELLNHLFSATRIERAAEAAGLKNLPVIRAQLVRSYSFLFDVDEVQDARTFEGNVTQALSLLNGNVTGYGTRAIPGTALAEILGSAGTDADKVSKIYLRILSRVPTETETARAVAFLKDAEARPVPATDVPSPPVDPKRPGKGGGKGAKGGKRPPPQDVGQLARLGTGRLKGPEDAHTRAFEDLFWVLLTSSESLMNH